MSNKTPPILSIIVPAWNAEATLARCIDSLLDQKNSYQIEIIISNDGSTDKTSAIIEKYRDFKGIIAISEENGGVCKARNRALQIASGKWITFVDSDDYVASGIYDAIIDILHKAEPDILEYQFSIVTTTNIFQVKPNHLPKNQLLDKPWIDNTILPVALNVSGQKEYFIESYSWNKVYKADILRAHNILFDETRRKWEDRLFTLTFLQYAKSYYSMSDYGYYYVCGMGETLSGKFEPDILRIIMDSYRKYIEMYGDRYNFDNPYTTNYFSNLLVDVAKDQFAHNVDPSVLKNMLSIFGDDAQVKMLFSNCGITEADKQKIITIIRSGNMDNIYTAFRKYSAAALRKEKTKQGIMRIRFVLSRVKQVFFSTAP